MELRQYINIFRRWFWLVLLGTGIAGFSAYIFSRTQQPIYQATSVLLIMEGSPSTTTEFSAIQSSERLAQSYIERLTNYEVLEVAIANLGLTMQAKELQESMQVSLVNNSHLIALSVKHTSPKIAAALANEIPTVFAVRNMELQTDRFASSKLNLETELNDVRAELLLAEAQLTEAQSTSNDSTVIAQLADRVLRLRDTHSRLLQSYEDIRIAEASSLNNIIIDQHARPPVSPISPRVLSNAVLGAAVGGMLSLGLIFLIEYLDDTIQEPEQIENEWGVTTIGLVPVIDTEKLDGSLVMIKSPRSLEAESYRQLRTNIQYVDASHDLKVILVTSPNPGDGKTTTAANLAISLAQMGKNVILVDADLRRPRLHQVFEVSNAQGLTNLFLEKENDEALLQSVEIPNLKVLVSGPIPPNPAELLGSPRMRSILDWLTEQADYIVLDSPPVLTVTDAILLSQIATTTLLVAWMGGTKQKLLELAMRQIRVVDGHLAGIVYNRISDKRHGSYYYYYRSNHYYESTASPNGIAKLLR
ncbi:MAG: polysaccharide biosynthesis tyrosine autokinase, partial [Anaerolineales bacterium]|nr:polysaccharide biosynthesis tyrosine autokinase [Anaerolineales bacterium]